VGAWSGCCRKRHSSNGPVQVEPEAAWYRGWRLLVQPSVPTRAQPYDFETAREYLRLKAEGNPAAYGRMME